MNADDFENQLQRQALRAVPKEWRAEILHAARAAASPPVPRLVPQAAPWWREWLWPAPQAWAGLAAMWIVIAVLNGTASPRAGGMARETPKPSPDAETMLATQRRELARLLDIPTEPTPAPKPPPGPRSEGMSPSKA